MRQTPSIITTHITYIVLLIVFSASTFLLANPIFAVNGLSIVDYRHKVDRRFVKKVRKKTKYIIIHTSEGGVSSTLRTVCKGKMRGGKRISYGGHANYVIARDGTIYRTLDKKYRADHAGVSMWNGEQDLSSCSIGIEMVGYHYGSFTSSQYSALSRLLDILQKVYHIEDKNVLTHSQIAYGRPNKWFNSNHRGRKKCAMNFDRSRAGLNDAWRYDPDVAAGRLASEKRLALLFYGDNASKNINRNTMFSTFTIIKRGVTAWNIAGEDYDAESTCYRLPNGKLIPGDEVEKRIGWERLPVGTRVYLHYEVAEDEESHPIKTITENLSAWSLAGANYNDTTTHYLFPNGKMVKGSQIRDWDDLPVGTKMLIHYEGPFTLTANRTAYSLSGQHYSNEAVIYYLPQGNWKQGNEIKDFNSLPKGTQVLLPPSLLRVPSLASNR